MTKRRMASGMIGANQPARARRSRSRARTSPYGKKLLLAAGPRGVLEGCVGGGLLISSFVLAIEAATHSSATLPTKNTKSLHAIGSKGHNTSLALLALYSEGSCNFPCAVKKRFGQRALHEVPI
jgi:hypothetical protein